MIHSNWGRNKLLRFAAFLVVEFLFMIAWILMDIKS